ncbi:putative enzyme related to lactoylglutathione lyase [Nocardia transvalensis]|uniref:Putative enzyme related to lactoylglutathione lyase n=1 Tax=Nocardia transvalensis TaxID=37333 RepID=A0A7W9PAN2_9NOCA|nr:VOC family protein [Nocardia transvalensis]MBB5912253.1 putative enzyme related to lactoylglutathione lyase [Nocardia transvalensis]
MSTRLACVVFDAVRPRAVARFWAELLGWEVVLDRPGKVDVAATDPDAHDVALTFLETPQPKSGKNGIHLDLATRSLDHQRVQVDRALSLGARHIDIGQGDVPWTVLADPEGNEFCVLEPREQYVDTGAIAAIVIDTRDPARLARFWSTASGWPVTHDDHRFAGIRSVTEQGPWLEFLRTPGGGQVPGSRRLHLDLIRFPSDDPDEEVARLRAAGATPVRPNASRTGGPPPIMADPETYEFCVLPPHDE